MKKFIVTDVHSTFYKVVDSTIALEEKRYIDPIIAEQLARKYNGEVYKVTKRLVETMEMEKV